MTGWWSRRSLRLRVAVVAAGTLAAGLVLGTYALATLFARSRIAALDEAAMSEARTVASLVDTGQLSQPLPAPGGSALLAQVLDAGGTVLASTATTSSSLGLLPPDQLDRLRLGVSKTLRDTAEAPVALRVVAVQATYAGVPVTVLAGVPLTDVEGTLDALRSTLLVVVPLLVLATASAAWLAVGSALRPVDELRAAAEGVSPATSGPPATLPVPATGDELTRLATTLNGMLRRLHAAGEQQRSFVADAAHELRTPLASMTTQLEVARRDAERASPSVGVADPGDELLDGLLAEVRRLSSLVADLLLLARLDAGADAALPKSDVDIAALAGLTGPPVTVPGHQASLARVVQNLRDNAERHGGSRVVTAATYEAGTAVLTVDDDGPGVPAEERERLFDRWHRRDAARSGPGSGLGLAIAREVARAHGGDVTLEASPLGGLRAVLRLPALDRGVDPDAARPGAGAPDSPRSSRG